MDKQELDNKVMLTAADVSDILGVKISRAYTIIRQLNKELQANGKLILRGKVNKNYFMQKISC